MKLAKRLLSPFSDTNLVGSIGRIRFISHCRTMIEEPRLVEERENNGGQLVPRSMASARALVTEKALTFLERLTYIQHDLSSSQ